MSKVLASGSARLSLFILLFKHLAARYVIYSLINRINNI